MNQKWFLGFGVLLTLAACAPTEQSVSVFLEENPENLSDWGVVVVAKSGSLALGQHVVPYDLNTPLFTDAAHKLRTLYVPPGRFANYRTSQALDFPVGSVLSKTFFYPKDDAGQLLNTKYTGDDFAGEGLNLAKVRLIETRVLVHREAGWVALPYIWNEAQTDAVLERTGGVQSLTLQLPDGDQQSFAYVVPNANQCAGCHAVNATTKQIAPIGPAPRHLNKVYPYVDGEQNQLAHLSDLGILDGFNPAEQHPRNANWQDERALLEGRAAAYLDINCGHCHNPHGAADTSALYLDLPGDDYTGGNSGLCKPPVAAGQGTGGRKFDIVPGQAEASILWYRMNSTNPAVMMPELGRSTIDHEGVALIANWINAMSGECKIEG
ncbi:MAG: hypothetical protein COA85_06190 [Robiginitomaculum sp.]|nr:MAG: hypothetical protein COA85_06190 [Robiginitomaculum sp.]